MDVDISDIIHGEFVKIFQFNLKAMTKNNFNNHWMDLDIPLNLKKEKEANRNFQKILKQITGI